MAARNQEVLTETSPSDTMITTQTKGSINYSTDVDRIINENSSRWPPGNNFESRHVWPFTQPPFGRKRKAGDYDALHVISRDNTVSQHRPSPFTSSNPDALITGELPSVRQLWAIANANAVATNDSGKTSNIDDMPAQSHLGSTISSPAPSIKPAAPVSALPLPVNLGGPSGNPSTLVLIEKVYVLWCSFDHFDFSNNSDKDLRTHLDQELEQTFLQQRGSRLSHEYLLQLTYAGARKDDLRPSVVLTTSSKKTRKIMKKVLSSKHIRDMLQTLRRDLWILVDSHQRASGDKAPTWPKEDVSVRGGTPTTGPSFCGSKLQIYTSESFKSSCVLGGFVLIGQNIYGLTASHPFPSKSSGDRDPSDYHNIPEDDDDSSDDEEPFHISGTDGPDGREDLEQGSPSTPKSTAPLCVSVTEEPWTQKSSPDSTHAFPVLSGHEFPPAPHRHFYPVYDGPNADWCALAFRDTPTIPLSDTVKNKIGGSLIVDICDFHHDQSYVVTIALPDGDIKGTLRPQTVLHRVDAQVFELRLVTVKQPIPAGCSGAWVTHDNQVCGVVLVVRERLPWIYVIPFDQVKRDMERVCGEEVRLPFPRIVSEDVAAEITSLPPLAEPPNMIMDSTPCDTCRSRKVRCGKQLPSCTYCQEWNLICTRSTARNSGVQPQTSSDPSKNRITELADNLDTSSKSTSKDVAVPVQRTELKDHAEGADHRDGHSNTDNRRPGTKLTTSLPDRIERNGVSLDEDSFAAKLSSNTVTTFNTSRDTVDPQSSLVAPTDPDSRPTKRLRTSASPTFNVHPATEALSQIHREPETHENQINPPKSAPKPDSVEDTTADSDGDRWINISETLSIILSHAPIREALFSGNNTLFDANDMFDRLKEIMTNDNGNDSMFRESDVHQTVYEIQCDVEPSAMTKLTKPKTPGAPLDENWQEATMKSTVLQESKVTRPAGPKAEPLNLDGKHIKSEPGSPAFAFSSARPSSDTKNEMLYNENQKLSQRTKDYRTLIQQQHAALKAQIALIEELEPDLKSQTIVLDASGRTVGPTMHKSATQSVILQSKQGETSQDEPEDQDRQAVPRNLQREVPCSIDELEKQRALDELRADVSSWLATVDSDGHDLEQPYRSRKSRPQPGPQHIPGPGLLIDVDSGDNYDQSDDGDDGENYPESPPVEREVMEARMEQTEDSVPGILSTISLNLQSGRLGTAIWDDNAIWKSDLANLSEVEVQPKTSNAAFMRFDEAAHRWETASRAATWGTQRHISESDLEFPERSRSRSPPLSRTGLENSISNSNISMSRMYKCQVPGCGESFAYSAELTRHARRHPYICPDCNQTFSRSHNLAQHRRTHETSADKQAPSGSGKNYIESGSIPRLRKKTFPVKWPRTNPKHRISMLLTPEHDPVPPVVDPAAEDTPGASDYELWAPIDPSLYKDPRDPILFGWGVEEMNNPNTAGSSKRTNDSFASFHPYNSQRRQ